jgi:hypothetical protein
LIPGYKVVLAAVKLIQAALVVTGQNFSMDVVTYLMVNVVVGLEVLAPLAGE